jgi:hypothetical protein
MRETFLKNLELIFESQDVDAPALIVSKQDMKEWEKTGKATRKVVTPVGNVNGEEGDKKNDGIAEPPYMMQVGDAIYTLVDNPFGIDDETDKHYKLRQKIKTSADDGGAGAG